MPTNFFSTLFQTIDNLLGSLFNSSIANIIDYIDTGVHTLAIIFKINANICVISV